MVKKNALIYSKFWKIAFYEGEKGEAAKNRKQVLKK